MLGWSQLLEARSRMNTCSSAHLQSKGDKTAWLLVLLQGPAQERPAHSQALVENQASANVPTYTSIKDAIEQEDKYCENCEP